MAEALRERGIALVHVIGPGTGHSYHPLAKAEVERRMKSLAIKGRERIPRRVSLETYTLKYNRMNWVTINALGEHWTKAHVLAVLENDSKITLTTENVTALSLDFPAGFSPFPITDAVTITIDSQRLKGSNLEFSDRSWSCHLERD